MTLRMFLIAVVAFCCNTQAADPVYILDFSRGASLKTLFEAGIRPTRRSTSRVEDKCEIRDTTLVFVFGNGRRIQIVAEQAEFSIQADDSIGEIVAESKNLQMPDIYPEAVRLFASIGTPPPGLQEACLKARATRTFDPLRHLGIGTPGEREPEVRAYFQAGDFVPDAPQEQHARLVVALYWESNMVRKKLRKEPIKPPAGYEQFSMEPVLSPSEVRRRRDMAAIAAAQTVTPVPSTAVPTATPNATPPPTTPVAQTPAPTAELKASVWPWVFGIAALAVVGWLVWKRRR